MVGKPDGAEEIVGIDRPVVLFSVTTGMTNDGDEEMFTDMDGIPDDMNGADVTLALALGDPDGVYLWNSERFETGGRVKGGMTGFELLAEDVGVPDTDEVPVAVLFEVMVGSPEEGKPPDEVLFNEAEGSPIEPDVWVLFNETVGDPEATVELGNPDRPVTLSEPNGGIVPEELLVGTVGTPDGADEVENPVDELLEDSVGDPDAALDEIAGVLDIELLISPVDELL